MQLLGKGVQKSCNFLDAVHARSECISVLSHYYLSIIDKASQWNNSFFASAYRLPVACWDYLSSSWWRHFWWHGKARDLIIEGLDSLSFPRGGGNWKKAGSPLQSELEARGGRVSLLETVGGGQEQPIADTRWCLLTARQVGLEPSSPTLYGFGVPAQEATATGLCPAERLEAGHLWGLQNAKALWISMAVLYRFINFHGWIDTRLSLQSLILWQSKWDQSWQIVEICVLSLQDS